MVKYVFGSPEWLAALHGIICERAATISLTDPEVIFSQCEVLENAPPEIANDGDRVVWSCIVRGSEVTFSLEERDDVTIKVVADYTACLPIARYDTRDEPDRVREIGGMMKTLAESGRLTVTRHPTLRNTLPSIHDATARLTA